MIIESAKQYDINCITTRMKKKGDVYALNSTDKYYIIQNDTITGKKT